MRLLPELFIRTGISLTVDQWKKLRTAMDEIDAAVARRTTAK
jgi:hypothetical protein